MNQTSIRYDEEIGVLGVLAAWPTWTTLAWHDVLSKYRRTILGPWWVTIGFAGLVFVISIIYPAILKVGSSDYVPYLTAGFLCWFYIVNSLTESCSILVNSKGILLSAPYPMTLIAAQTTARSLIIFAHNFIVYIFVLAIYMPESILTFPIAVIGLFLLLIVNYSLNIILGILGARYRDIQESISVTMTVLFFLTPIIWRPEDLPDRPLIVLFNPIYHLIEVVRAPLLGGIPNAVSFVASTCIAFGLLGVAALLHHRYGRYVRLWL